MADWIEDFVEYSSYGEASKRLMRWVGISTIAAALRRKVWFDMGYFQWSPNFYILVVGANGAIRKSTSIDVGMALLANIPQIYVGAEMATWQALVQDIAGKKETVCITDKDGCIEYFDHSSVTIPVSEFGSFFDPANRELVDCLTSLWDGKKGTIRKMTKTSGTDEMVNPWINVIAGTTPSWLAKNFSADLVGGGYAGRCIFLYEEMPAIDISYPHRGMPTTKPEMEAGLVRRLEEFAGLAGAMDLTEAAYEWGDEWYKKERALLRTSGTDSLEAGFTVRKQVHLHKLAMVLAVSKGKFPVIDVEDLQEADFQLSALSVDTRRVFGYVGQTKVTSALREIVEIVTRANAIEKRILYRDYFARTMSYGEFNEAVLSAIQAELILESDGVAKPILLPRK